MSETVAYNEPAFLRTGFGIGSSLGAGVRHTQKVLALPFGWGRPCPRQEVVGQFFKLLRLHLFHQRLFRCDPTGAAMSVPAICRGVCWVADARCD